MNDDGSEDEQHFSHTCTADGHFLFAFFEEAMMKILKNGYVFYPEQGIHVENLAKSTGRLSAHVRGMNA